MKPIETVERALDLITEFIPHLMWGGDIMTTNLYLGSMDRERLMSFISRVQQGRPFTSKQAPLVIKTLLRVKYLFDEKGYDLNELARNPRWKKPLDSHLIKNNSLSLTLKDDVYYAVIKSNYNKSLIESLVSLNTLYGQTIYKWMRTSNEDFTGFSAILLTPITAIELKKLSITHNLETSTNFDNYVERCYSFICDNYEVMEKECPVFMERLNVKDSKVDSTR